MQNKLLDENARRISNGTITNDILEIRWPLGVPPPSIPETRHDIIVWINLNETHQFMPDSEYNVKPLSDVDREDFRKILNRTVLAAQMNYPHLVYDSLHTAYKRFDPVRSMDYQLNLNFMDKITNSKMLKRYAKNIVCQQDLLWSNCFNQFSITVMRLLNHLVEWKLFHHHM